MSADTPVPFPFDRASDRAVLSGRLLGEVRAADAQFRNDFAPPMEPTPMEPTGTIRFGDERMAYWLPEGVTIEGFPA